MMFLGAGFLLAAEPADEVPDEVPYEKLDEAGKNIIKMNTAAQLKEIGWGENVKGGRPKNYSLESLLAAARMYRELPKMGEAKLEEVTATEAKDTPKLEVKPFDALAESKLILDRVKEIVDTFDNAKEKEAFMVLVSSIEKIDNSKAIVGGPKTQNFVLHPGQTQTFTFRAYAGQTSVVLVRTSGPTLRFKMVRVENDYVHYHQSARYGQYTWSPKGASGTAPAYRMTVHNPQRVPVQFTVALR